MGGVGEDPHATRRERKRRKARYGMRVMGTSARTLARLIRRPPGTRQPAAGAGPRTRKRKRRSKIPPKG